jgi:pyrroline-5-carboxylate reductase
MRVGFIGAGNMARALARGWGDPVLCSDAGSGRARALVEELGGEAFESNLAVAERADLVVLCHKPAQLAVVAAEIAGTARAVASVLGATTIEALRDAYPDTPVFRLMPNTPVEVRRGIVCYAAAPDVRSAPDAASASGVAIASDSADAPLASHAPDAPPPADLERQVLELFARLGTVVQLEERLIDPASAVMGVGPAYQALVAEAQVDAAVRYGLGAAIAGQMVTETMAGTAALLEARAHDTLTVRREVTSPGGSTARGLAALERAGVRGAFQDATDAVLGWSRR